MFQRRVPLSFIKSIQHTLWPKMGWWRLIKYYRLRIVRLSSSTESIALNLAAGSAMSFTPFFGFHFLIALGFTWLVGKANIVAAMVGTFVGNPWTFPFLMIASYSLGNWILSFLVSDINATEGFNFESVEEDGGEAVIIHIWNNFSDIFLPTALGGTILAVLSCPLYYMLYYYLVRGAQRAKRLRMKRKQRQLFNRKSKGKLKRK